MLTCFSSGLHASMLIVDECPTHTATISEVCTSQILQRDNSIHTEFDS